MFHVQQTPAASVVEVVDDLDAFSCPDLEKAVGLAEAHGRRIVVTLAHCDYCDSSGLAVLIRLKRRLGEKLTIVVPSKARVRKIFEVTDLVSALNIVDV